MPTFDNPETSSYYHGRKTRTSSNVGAWLRRYSPTSERRHEWDAKKLKKFYGLWQINILTFYTFFASKLKVNWITAELRFRGMTSMSGSTLRSPHLLSSATFDPHLWELSWCGQPVEDRNWLVFELMTEYTRLSLQKMVLTLVVNTMAMECQLHFLWMAKTCSIFLLHNQKCFMGLVFLLFSTFLKIPTYSFHWLERTS